MEEKGLTIARFKSAWFVDLIASYILENSQDLFSHLSHNEIYHDDDIGIDNVLRSCS